MGYGQRGFISHTDFAIFHPGFLSFTLEERKAHDGNTMLRISLSNQTAASSRVHQNFITKNLPPGGNHGKT